MDSGNLYHHLFVLHGCTFYLSGKTSNVQEISSIDGNSRPENIPADTISEKPAEKEPAPKKKDKEANKYNIDVHDNSGPIHIGDIIINVNSEKKLSDQGKIDLTNYILEKIKNDNLEYVQFTVATGSNTEEIYDQMKESLIAKGFSDDRILKAYWVGRFKGIDSKIITNQDGKRYLEIGLGNI